MFPSPHGRWSAITPLLSILLLALLGVGAAAAAEAGLANAEDSEPRTFELRIRDALTGHVLAHSHAAVETSGITLDADAEGRVGTKLATDSALRVGADGYETLRIRPTAAEKAAGRTTVWLRPDQTPEPLRPELIEARRFPGTTMIHGHVFDAASGAPLAAARVRLDRAGIATTTDEDGYFTLYAKSLKVLDTSDVPELDVLVVEARGFAATRLDRVALMEQDSHFIVDLERGSGKATDAGRTIDVGHKLFRSEIFGEDGLELENSELPENEAPNLAGLRTRTPSKATTGGLQVMNPVDSIQVSGYGWYGLETYVARGLCSEWISSWGTNSLDAGAIAYRTYGSYWQANYGYICNTTGCQVFANNYNVNCDLASQRTTGVLLQKSGAIAFSEYSAENNSYVCGGYSCVNTNLGCGYGSAGTPGSWSCLADNHTFDQGPGACCFGHGHGMCQWGTHAWSRAGKKWNWMANHYYNDFGSGTGNRQMYLTTPVEITSGSGSPSSISAGSSFTVNANLRSYADHDHDQLLLGAELKGPATLTDSGNTAKVTANGRGSSTYANTGVSRTFAVSGGAASGTYDLELEIWFDSDGDDQIDSTDQLLHQATFTNAVTISGGGGGGGWTQTVDDNAAYLGGPSQYWWQVTGYGHNNQMHYTYSEPTSGTNWIYWYFDVPQNGNYAVEVYIPSNHATTQSARYYVHNGSSWVGPYTVNQNIYYDQWVTLTHSVYLQAGSRIVYVGDVTGEASGSRKVGVDSARLTLQ